MKKKILALAAGILMVSNLFAMEIGALDPKEIYEKYPEAKKIQQELENEKLVLDKKIEEGKAILKKMKSELDAKGDKATKEDQKAFENKQLEISTELQILNQKLSQNEYNKIGKLNAEISMAIDEVAKSKNIDLVIDKSTVYYAKEGLNVDITNDVLQFLSNAEEVSLEEQK